MKAKARRAPVADTSPAWAASLDPAAVLAALPLPVAIIDGHNRFIFANAAAEQFFGCSLVTLRQLSLADLLPEDNRLFAVLQQVRLSGAEVADHELELESPRLEHRSVAVHAAPFPDLPAGVVLTLKGSSAAQLFDRRLHFQGAVRSARALAAMLAHEVKNPLSGIRGAAQLLEQNAPEGDRDLCRLILDEVDRIRGLVERVEIFSERPVELSAVNIHEVLDHVRRIAETGFAAHLRLIRAYDPSLPPVWGNRHLLVQILLNLVKNAAEAVDPNEGEIVLATAYRHGLRIAVPGSTERIHLPLEVSVRDNGPGIPEAIRANLFEPFVSSKRGGQGLGLAIAAKLVADLGGLIECDSRPGRTVFRIALPAAPQAVPGVTP